MEHRRRHPSREGRGGRGGRSHDACPENLGRELDRGQGASGAPGVALAKGRPTERVRFCRELNREDAKDIVVGGMAISAFTPAFSAAFA